MEKAARRNAGRAFEFDQYAGTHGRREYLSRDRYRNQRLDLRRTGGAKLFKLLLAAADWRSALAGLGFSCLGRTALGRCLKVKCQSRPSHASPERPAQRKRTL